MKELGLKELRLEEIVRSGHVGSGRSCAGHTHGFFEVLPACHWSLFLHSLEFPCPMPSKLTIPISFLLLVTVAVGTTESSRKWALVKFSLGITRNLED